ncbi:TetR/AcrR family transcriptional regulator [Thioclava sp. FR2]|uniref:TetR/AcrR family transcriptional regulator n=1 Tax=Thioclava sp. FR2 TaxID=3445780 RepID=UPI003EBA7E2C
MTGLRAQNKADRTRRILESASRLFRESGFDSVRIEDIAMDAQMSPGTVYNYFSTKGDVLLAIVAMEVEEVLVAGETLVADPQGGFDGAMTKLIGGYYDHSLKYLSKAMWRTAMAQSIAHPETAFSRHYTELDQRLTDQISALISKLQSRGDLRADLEANVLGVIIFNDINMMFVEFVKNENASLKTLRRDLKAHLQQFSMLLHPSPDTCATERESP